MRDISDAIFRGVVETSLAGLVLLQQDRVIYANEAMERMLGCETGQLAFATDLLGSIHAEDRERVAAYLEERASGADDSAAEACRVVSAAGVEVFAHIRAQRVDHKGEPALVCSVMDVSEHRRFLERLEQSEQKHRGIVEQSDDGIVLMDEQGAIVEWNHAQERISGQSRDQVVGRPAWEVMFEYFPEERRDPTLQELFRFNVQAFLRTGEGPWLNQLLEHEIQRPDGTRCIIQTRYFAIETPRGFMCGNVTRDITERRRMEEQLRAHKSRLQSLASQLARVEEQERRRIATDLHDQIGQTLAAASMKIGALRQAQSNDAAAARLSEVQQLLARAIEGTRSLTFDLAPPVLYELGLEAAVEWLAERTQAEHGLRVEFESAVAPLPLGQETQVGLFRCVRELLANVVKHARAEQATVSFGRDGGYVRVVVEDDGIGVAPSTEDAAGRTATGFGLFNVRERIEQFGGRFELDSEPGHGTRVSLMVPASSEAWQR